MLGALEDGLEPGKPRPFELTVGLAEGASAAHVRLLVERINADESKRIPLLDRRRPLP